MTTVNKVIVTNKCSLQRKYGGNWTNIQAAITELMNKDLTRGLSSELIFLDDHTVMSGLGGVAVLSDTSPQQNLEAVKAVVTARNPTYVMLLGSIDVIPHQNLTNPIYGDGNLERDPDETAWSDLPYASRVPYSQNIGDFVTPTVSVGRLPDITHGTDANYLIGLLHIAKDYQCQPRSAYKHYMGLSKLDWQPFTELSLKADFGNATAIKVIDGMVHSPWPTALLKNLSHFVNCEGLPFHPKYFASGVGFANQVALDAEELKNIILEGTVVAAECCYGAQLYNPALAGNKPSMGNVYLANKAYGYLGTSTVAYGGTTVHPRPVDDFAVLICQFFMKHILAGASLGGALLLTRQEYVGSKTPLSDTDLKTLAQFNLMGDPSLRPVCVSRS